MCDKRIENEKGYFPCSATLPARPGNSPMAQRGRTGLVAEFPGGFRQSDKPGAGRQQALNKCRETGSKASSLHFRMDSVHVQPRFEQGQVVIIDRFGGNAVFPQHLIGSRPRRGDLEGLETFSRP